jgi:branched-chain amino acid transport system ATP-binding protein
MLRVSDLDVFYGDAQALWGVSMNIDDGEVVSVVGSNGAGKSTLVNAIMGIIEARRGSVLLDDVDITGVPGHRTCQAGVAIVPEGRRLFHHLSVKDNLDLGAYNKEARSHHEESINRVPTSRRAK